MTDRFVVVRYIPDPARNEALNVGILLYGEVESFVAIDEAAVARVVRENPQLERDALLYLEPQLEAELAGAGAREVEKFLTRQKGFPVVFTEPRFTTVAEDGYQVTLQRLVDRVVRPRRRSGGSGPNPLESLARELRAHLRQGDVQRNHFFQGSRSGIPRQFDFYANSKVNVALDVLRLAVAKADDIRQRADAEAFKVWDVSESTNTRFCVYCVLASDDTLSATYVQAQRSIEAAGAIVVTDLDEAASVITGAGKLI